ncbi:MAG: hypothetical protein J6336_04850 [Kiritimatiellae bacterium]|nr:hypothetical protein [Kiritimatiellia bacterium]
MKSGLFGIIALGATILTGSVWADTTYQPGTDGWGAALTVGDGETVIIDGGSGNNGWGSAVTVNEGGTLKVRGNIKLNGTTTVAKGGTLDIETGTAYCAFGARTATGTVIIRSGAKLDLNCSDAFNYSNGFIIHVYGTLSCFNYRISVDNTDLIYIHDGARVTGAGDGNGAIDLFKADCRIIVDGESVIEGPIKSRITDQALFIACCENAHPYFKGGFIYGTSANGKGNITQVAATAEEGNAAGTCANAVIEIGPSTNQGKFIFISDAIVALTGATPSFSVESSAAGLTFVADKATASTFFANVQTLPAITAANATVTLKGAGIAALQDAAPAFPITFDGAALQIAAGTPVALAAGSSVTAATLVGVDNLAANTAATLFTGADAAFDVTKLSATAMRNGIALGTAVSPTLADGAVSITGVAAYDPDAWIEPFIQERALIWLDASEAANFIFTDTLGEVAVWKDRSLCGRDASYYDSPSANYQRYHGTLGVSAGVPAFLMGTTGSCIDLKYARMTTMRSIFWVMAIEQNGNAWFLGDSGAYRFHRTTTLAYAYDNANVYFKNGSIYCDGVKAENPVSTIPPTDRHVYSTVNTSNNMESDYLTSDVRDANNAGPRSGGRDISEFIAFDFALSDADRQAIEAYLATKWMGANPTAATDANTYTLTSTFDVGGSVSGDKNLVFTDGAAVAISDITADKPALATTGSVTLPAGTAIPVTVDAQTLQPGTYTLISAASGITSLDQFAATAATANGVSATFAVTGGKLTMTLAVTTASAAQTWRPADASDLGWNATSANWLLDGGVMSGFLGYIPAIFDGNETVSGEITVSGTHTMGPLNVSGAKDYTFIGDGTLLGTETITLGGTGTVMLNGVGLGDQPIVITDGQKVALGADAPENTLGTDGGKVTIKDGGQLNINYTSTASNNTEPRQELTHHKVFVLSGDGPDGRGALINDALDGRGTANEDNPYGSQLRRVELANDATVGGTHRMEVRLRSGTYATAEPGIYGPDKRLTIKSTNPYGFGLISQPINVGAVTIAEGATFRPEAMAESQFNIPGGITFEGGILHAYSSTYPDSVPFLVTDKGGTINAASGTATLKGPVTVATGGKLTLNGGNVVYYQGGITAQGDVETTGGTHVLAGPMAFANMPILTGGGLYIGSGFSANSFTLEHASGSSGFFLNNTAPNFETANFTVTGGAFDIRPQAAGILDIPGTVNLTQTSGTSYAYGPNTNTEYGVAMKLVGTIENLSVGLNSNRSGTLELKAGSDLTTKALWTGNNGSGPSTGRVIIDHDAKVTLTTDSFRNGHWSGTPAVPSVHRLDVYGEVDALPAILWNTYDCPRGEVYLHEGGVLRVKGIWANRHQNNSNDTYNHPYGNGTDPGAGRHWFLMEGGRLELGSSGFGGARTPGVTRFDFQNGEIVNVSGAWGGDAAFPIFFGYEKLGGKVTFDMGEYYVNWNNGLSGASDVTIKGSVNFQGQRTDERLQGAMLGKLTVENTGGNDLTVTSYFGGGLTLADGVNAQVAKYSDNQYPFAIAGNVQDQIATADWSYPFIASDFWTFIHRHYNANPRRTYTSFAGRGEFYVPEEKAGKWTFAGNYDDNIRLDVDGTQVFKSASWTAAGVGTVELSAGWHAFTLSSYDGTGGIGPGQATWTDGKAIGFIIGESTSTTSSDYTKFEPNASLGDGLTLQVRPKANACIWSFQNGNANWETTENWTTIKCTDTVIPMHKHSNASDAGDWSAYFSGKVNKFEGWFKVAADQKGEWTFKMGYDDYKKLHIDGEELINNTSWTATPTATKTLEAGWHRWSVRVGDGSGGWGPSAANNGNTLSYIAPGAEEKQFNEQNLTLAATLGDIAAIEPTGIYRDLVLGDNAVLTSTGTMPMPIFGTLKGTGTLAGAFAFAGDESDWDVTGKSANRELVCATFANATRETFQGLAHVTATFDEKPRCSFYFLTDEITGLTAEDVEDATVTVKDGENDYSEDFALTVKEGRLALANLKPGGFLMMLR